MSTEITKQQPGFMELIQQAMSLPAQDGLDRVELIERLYALKERDDAKTCERNYEAALLRVQKKAPRILQNGMMVRINQAGKDIGRIPYAKREDIDAVMRPIYQPEGFTVTWDYPMLPDGRIDVQGTFSACGHTVVRHFPCLPDPSGGKTGPQAVSSTGAYGKRQISKAQWDIIEEGLDKNGAKPEDVTPISQEQADDIRTRMNDLPQSKSGFFCAKLCQKHRVGSLEELRASQLEAVLADVKMAENAAEAKRK